ncbi:MAG: hypothetical protein ACYC0B_04655 [Gemmatimonadaceae bacterium]
MMMRARRGSALLLVLLMTTAMAALVLSAIYLNSLGTIVSGLRERERDFRYAAEAALALGKSRVNRDTTLAVPADSFATMFRDSALVDAGGIVVPRARVTLHYAFTGDTTGRFGEFVTLLARASDDIGTRHVRRLDLTAESFSRFAMFTNTWPGGLAYGTGEFIRGRSHSNGNWRSSGSPGPAYFDTVSAVGTITGTASYNGLPTQPGAAVIPFPTVEKLSALPGYATTSNLNFAPVSGTAARATSNGTNISGRASGNAVRGSRLEFVTVDADGSGTLSEDEGMIRIFDLAAGMDTSRLRADLAGSPVAFTDPIVQSQCGAMFTIGGRQEFFPISSFRMAWVRNRIRTSTFPTVTAAQANTYSGGSQADVLRVLRLATARCFPAGSPYLLLSERLVDNVNCNLTMPNPANGFPYSWGSAPACPGATQYGGQDTTFTPNPRSCYVNTTPAIARCTGNSVPLGEWRAAPAAIRIPALAASARQESERTYLWTLAKPHNLNSKGVVHASAGPLWVSGELRGTITLYVLGDVVFIDDLRYDEDPTGPDALCRNFLGIIARDNVMVADNSINRPRVLATPAGTAGNTLFLGPDRDFFLDAVTMSLTGTVGVEDYAGSTKTNPASMCPKTSTNSTSGGCINQTGGVIQQEISATYSGNGTGLRENRTVDPCQLTNRKPPFFPTTQRYLENKYYEIDPAGLGSDAAVASWFAKLRG